MKSGDRLKFFYGISHIYHFQHLCQEPKNKERGGVYLCSILRQKQLWENFEFFSRVSIPLEEYTSGERSKKMHVAIDCKDFEKIINYIKKKHVGI